MLSIGLFLIDFLHVPYLYFAAAKGAQLLAFALDVFSPKPKSPTPMQLNFVFNEGSSVDQDAMVRSQCLFWLLFSY
jgi:hypothetical protein